MSQDEPRFRGFAQLVGEQSFSRIASSSVCVIGLGGVGSWVVEALARCGIGAVSLVDLDEVCITNVNRQLHALSDHVGKPKADLLRDRVMQINPGCNVLSVRKFFTRENADQILLPEYDLIIDTIDSVDHKTDLILECVYRDLPVITAGSGGERLNPLSIKLADLAYTEYDPLLQIVRKRLRQQHDFPRGERGRFDIPCVYAPLQRGPRRPAGCEVEEGESKTRKSCNDGLGSAVFMTGSMGFVVASEAVRLLSLDSRSPAYSWKEKRWGGQRPPVI